MDRFKSIFNLTELPPNQLLFGGQVNESVEWGSLEAQPCSVVGNHMGNKP